MTLVAKGVKVSRDTVEKAVEQIALSCCWGVVQHSVILELIETGKVPVRIVEVPSTTGSRINDRWQSKRLVRVYGSKGRSIGNGSWTNLKKRLKNAGFTLEEVGRDVTGDYSIVMYWNPERTS